MCSVWAATFRKPSLRVDDGGYTGHRESFLCWCCHHEHNYVCQEHWAIRHKFKSNSNQYLLLQACCGCDLDRCWGASISLWPKVNNYYISDFCTPLQILAIVQHNANNSHQTEAGLNKPSPNALRERIINNTEVVHELSMSDSYKAWAGKLSYLKSNQ